MMRKRFIRALSTGRGLLLSSALLLLACAIAYLAVEIRSDVVVSRDGLFANRTVAYWAGLAVLAFAAVETVRLLWTTAECVVAGVELAWQQVLLFRSWSGAQWQRLRPASGQTVGEGLAEAFEPDDGDADIGPEPVGNSGDPLAVWARGVIATGGSVTITALIEESGGNPSKETFERELLKASKRLVRERLGIVPDARFGYLYDDPARTVGLFALAEARDRVEAPTETFGHAVFTLGILAALMHADDHVADEEAELLGEIAREFDGLNRNENSAVLAWAAHLADHPIAFGRLTRRLKTVDLAMRPQLYDRAVRMVQADHRVHPAEVEMLEKICRSFEIPQADLYRSLGAWRPADTSLRRTQSEAPAASGTNDTATDGNSGEGMLRESAEIIVLDQRRVSSIESDTAEVAVLLSDVFVEEPEPSAVADESSDADQETELDPAHRSLLAWIAEHGEVSRESFEQFARANQLMPEGALETLNDWSLEKYEDEVVEDGETVAINATLVEYLKLDGVNDGTETDQAARA